MRLFSPWEYDVDAAAARLLANAGWEFPERNALPTGAELVESYLLPLARTPQLAPRIRIGTRVLAVSRSGVDKTRTVGREGRPYVVRTVRDGQSLDLQARAVIDASGTWGRSNPLGAAGLPAIGEEQAAVWLTGPLPDVLGRDRKRFAGRHTLVVGMGHSAANTLLALVQLRQEEPGTEITWAIRGRSPARLYGGGDADGLPARGLLGSTLKAAVATGAITLEQASYAVWGARIGYQINRNWSAALNVSNLFDKTYFQTIGAPAWGNVYGEPRSAMVTLRGKF